MRLLDTYALYCGAKIDKPFIYESYFPLPFSRYITFQAETPYDSRNYAYWQDVLDMLYPVLLKAGIQIIQTGLQKEAAYKRVIDLRGQTNFHQLAYLLRRSMLHVGPDSFGVHLATSFDTPTVAIYSISMPEVAGPHFGSKDKQILFKGYERIGNKKPSFAPQESPKSINAIKPEEVAQAVFKLLGIDFQIPFETMFCGNRYCNAVVRELIPNTPHFLPFPEQPIEIRADLHYEERLFVHQMNYWQKPVVVTNKPIPIDILRHYKGRIGLIAYHITENDSPEFCEAIVNAGLPLIILSRLPEEELQKRKIKYYEFGVINRIPEPDAKIIEALRKDMDKLYYRGNKFIASDGKVFGSQADVEAGTPLNNDFEYRKVIDSPKFWQDLDFFTIVKKL